MNIFEQFVIPPSQEHVGLLIAMQVISMLMFLPFASMFTGSTILSVYFKRKANKTGNNEYLMLSKDIINKITAGKGAGYAFGILPLASIVLIYTQFLYGMKIISVGLFFLSLILYIAGFLLIYNYKNTFRIKSVIDTLGKDTSNLPEDIVEYKEQLVNSNTRFGTYGIYALLVASFIFIGSATIAADPLLWISVDGILKLILSGKIWINYFYFLSSSFAVTGGAMLYFLFVWQGGVKDRSKEYIKIGRNVAVAFALTGSIVQAVFLFLGVLLLPGQSLSPYVYVYSGLTLLSILLVCNLLYFVYRDSDIKYTAAVFFLMFVTFMFGIVKDQLAFKNAVKDHLITVNAKAEELAKEKSSSIVQASGADGEKIYNEKCIACHKFDEKLVGPPYKETVPKYNGDLKKLAGFIYNPQKINPAYPPMPNQGLKQKEAEAVAKYLLDKVGAK